MSRAPLPGLFFMSMALFGCATPPAPPSPTAKRISLSQAQETAIQAGMAKSLKDMPNPAFPLLAAAVEPDGATFVCGTAKPEGASYQKVTPFALLLKGTDPVILAIGGNERDNIAVKELCKSKGIDGFGELSTGPKPKGWMSSLLGG